MVFDLTGDGRTVLKGNYGLYWHNPGVGVPDNANPNTGTKSATYGWNDLNGDSAGSRAKRRRCRPPSLEGAIQLDPNSRRRIRTKRPPGSSARSPRRSAFAPVSSTRPKTI